ncbi:MAG: heat-inducible transcriptional repressor HrcA [Thermoanaerobacteraceae bacterium]|nr:heat-inducible transcriptional repressor HrcA [Thermoanaerobacteraceae bacterium]
MILTGRKRKILEAIIGDYITTAEPVGSRTLAKNYNLGISPATIRNEMADLEEMGYLEQPHTSAGRIPSDKGYRVYVDEILMNRHAVRSGGEFFYLKGLNSGGIEKLLKEALKIISDLTEYTSIALTPHAAESTIKQLELLQFNENSVVVVLVTDSGTIKNTIIKLNSVISSKEIDILNLHLNRMLKGHSVEEINENIIKELKDSINLPVDIKWLVCVIKNLLVSETGTEVLVEGTTNFFKFPEYRDIDRVKTILSFIEDTRMILNLLMPFTNNDISITIGSENTFEEVKDCSIITVTYNIKGKNAGTISIIGPKRMNYERVITIMDDVGARLNRILTDYLYGK